MVLVRQLVLPLGVLGLCVTHLRADVRLFDQRIEKQEITELRYTVPDGCTTA